MQRWRRIHLLLLGRVGLVVALGLLGFGMLRRHVPRQPTTRNRLGNPTGIVDRLVLLDSIDAFGAGTLTSAEARAGSPPVICLADAASKQYPRVGQWTSAPIIAEFPFTELLPSWNAHTPVDAGLQVEVRVRDHRRGEWSAWLGVGAWGRTRTAIHPVVAFNSGVVNVDNVVLDRPADAMQVRLTLVSFSMDPMATPAVRRVALCYSGIVTDAQARARLCPPVTIEGSWVRDLPVQFRAQHDAPAAIRSQLCSPTSVSMVLAYWGVDRPTVENALAIYDPDHAIFGNWNRAVARAGELGLDAWLDRFRDWDKVKACIARGQPIVASISFARGEFPSAVLSSSKGHLLVIRGFAANGDVIVNDPGSKPRGNGAIYRASELAHAWFDHGGVGYVIARPKPTETVLR